METKKSDTEEQKKELKKKEAVKRGVASPINFGERLANRLFGEDEDEEG
jgi:hypothetical protein